MTAPTPLPVRDWHDIAPRPDVCPLAAALGRTTACAGGGCVYFGIPGVPAACAIEHWAPDVADDPDLARWYLDRAAGGDPTAA
jgi:hypothetical protein